MNAKLELLFPRLVHLGFVLVAAVYAPLAGMSPFKAARLAHSKFATIWDFLNKRE